MASPPTKLIAAVVAVTVLAGSGIAAGSRTAQPRVKLLITDTSGKPVARATAGQLLRFAAVPKVGRVCVAGNTSGICASPQKPYVLIRRVNDNLVVRGRVRASVVDFGRTLATRSIPVEPTSTSGS